MSLPSALDNPAVLYTVIGLCGLVAGPFALRFVLGLAPGGLKERAAKWQLHRALSMGDGWLVHQDGDRSYKVFQIDTDRDAVEVEGETVDLSNLGHISTKTGSIPMGVSYGPKAVGDSPLVGISPGTHVSAPPVGETDDGPDDDPDDSDPFDDDSTDDTEVIFGDMDSDDEVNDG
jgi:hypothetical protein